MWFTLQFCRCVLCVARKFWSLWIGQEFRMTPKLGHIGAPLGTASEDEGMLDLGQVFLQGDPADSQLE